MNTAAASLPSTAVRPSWSLTISFWLALAALYFTSEIWLVFVIAFLALWPHFLAWRLPRDSTATWIMRLVVYGGVFAVFGGQPGVGADWIFDAKTFNMIGLISAGEALIEFWREPPPGARYYSIIVLCIAIVFLAACNTYDDRYIKLIVPFYLLFTLLALREWRSEVAAPNMSFPRGRGVLALAFVLVLGAATHFGILWQREQIMRWGYEMVYVRRLFQGTGISKQPRLGSTFNLRGSTRRVLRIEGALNSPHLRAAAFDTYANGTWSPPVSGREKTSFPEESGAPGAGENQVRITKLHDLDQLIFAPLNAVAVTPGQGSSFDWNKTLGPVTSEDPAPYTYEVTWSDKGDALGVPLHQGVLCAPLSAAADRKRMLQLPPEVDPRVHELAFELTATALHPAEKVEEVVEHLLQNHKYSRTTNRGKGDPVSNFILGKKSAHCEYFASAAVVLLRAAGVPSRYVTGYVAHESADDGTVVRQRDAHAWAEAWIDGFGWVTVDATPADGTPEAHEPVGAGQRAWEKLQDTFARLREQATALSGTQIFILIFAVIVIWLFERWRIRRRQQSQSSTFFAYSAPPDLIAIAARFERILKTQVGELSPSKPLGEYSCDQAAIRFLREYHRARFGGVRDEHTLRELDSQIEQLEKQASGKLSRKGIYHGTNIHNTTRTHGNSGSEHQRSNAKKG